MDIPGRHIIPACTSESVCSLVMDCSPSVCLSGFLLQFSAVSFISLLASRPLRDWPALVHSEWVADSIPDTRRVALCDESDATAGYLILHHRCSQDSLSSFSLGCLTANHRSSGTTGAITDFHIAWHPLGHVLRDFHVVHSTWMAAGAAEQPIAGVTCMSHGGLLSLFMTQWIGFVLCKDRTAVLLQ